jgi:hypothetical protein
MARRHSLARGASTILLLLQLAGCSGGSALSNQVIVHLDENPNDLAGAQRVADATCRARGGRARLMTVVNNDTGMMENEDTRPPDAVFACDPATR